VPQFSSLRLSCASDVPQLHTAPLILLRFYILLSHPCLTPLTNLAIRMFFCHSIRL
jgi:hypothetical protein